MGAPIIPHRVWIGGLDTDVSVEALRAMFEPFGSISEDMALRIELGEAASSEAVVTFDWRDDASSAFAMDGTELLRGLMYIEWYVERPGWSLFTEP